MCRPGEVWPCPYHALLDHRDRCVEHFGIDAVPGLSVFPTVDGRVVDKKRVVEALVHVASKLGIDTHDRDGACLFGGHSLRVTGAQWLASMGVPLLTIQLLARWASDVILHYVAEAPLCKLTDTYRRVAGGVELGVVVDGIVNGCEAMRNRIADMGARIEAMVVEEADIRKQLATTAAKITDTNDFSYVASEGRGRNTHVIVTRPLVGVPPQMWKTRCGWRFGLSTHTLLKACGPVDKLCTSCRPDIREFPEDG